MTPHEALQMLRASRCFDGVCRGLPCACAEAVAARSQLERAAPDMLAALQTALCHGGGYTGQPEGEYPTTEACLKAGCCGCDQGAAVKKATTP